jgi:hypothetical protein
MAATKVYAGTVGLGILIDMIDAITGATNLKLYVERGDGTATAWTPTINGTTKLLYATAAAADLVPGVTKITPSFTLAGWSGLGETVQFTVYDRYQ